MKKIKFLTLLVLSGALLLPACNATANSIINDISSQAGQSSSSQAGGNSSQSTPAPSSSNSGGQSSSNSSSSARPSSSSQPGSSSSSQPSSSSSSQGGSGETRYEITADEWKALFTDLSLFGPNYNVTLNQVIRMGSIPMESGVLENNNGDLHMLNNSMGEEPFEMYVDLLANGTYEIYDLDDNGKWEKFVMPESYTSVLNSSFTQYIPPMEYSTFTYNTSDHAYWSQGGTVTMGEGQSVDVSDVCVTFENGKFMSLTYTISMGQMSAISEVIASKYGSTFFDFPEIGSHGQGEDPDENLFVNSLFRYKELKGCQLYSADATKDQVEGLMATSEIMLFEDGEFEMYYKDAVGLRNVILGSYTVVESSALLITRSLYSDKSRTYSFDVPALYEEFSLYYNEQNEDYEISLFIASDEGDLIAKVDLAFTRTSEQPMHLDLPQEPANDKWSVNGDTWNKYFGGAFINRQTNITINHGDNLLEFDAGKVHSVVSMAAYGGAGISELYFRLLNDDLNKVDYYEYDKSAQIWTVRENVDYAFDVIQGPELGIKEYDFASATYSSSGHYYSIKKFVEYPYGPEAEYYEAFQDIKIYFENGQLQKISYKNAYNVEEVFLYSKAGSTSVKLPEVGSAPILEDMFVNKAYKYNSYSSSNTAFNIGYYAASLANDEIRFFHDTTDYTFEWLMDNRYYDGSSNNSIVLCGLYKVNRSSSSLFEYQYYITLNVKNVYVNGVELDSETDYQLFETLVLYYFEADNKMCYREDSVSFMGADGRYDYTDLKLYFNYLGENSFHFPLPRLDDNWSQYDVIMAMSQIGVMNDNLPNMHYVKRFVIGQIDTTNKAFDITCEMPNKFFIDHIFEPYKEALVSQYKFSAQYSSDGEIVAVVSPNGEFKVTFEVQEDWIVIFHVQYYTASIPEAEYPSADINRYLTANNITDPVPEFKVAGATQYYPTVSDEYAAVFIYLDKTLIDNAVTALIKLLTDLEYTPSTIGDTTVYSSKNNQVSVVITSNPDYGMINVMLMKPVSSSILSAYPSDKLNEYLRGVRDTVPSFDHQDGEQYMTFGPNDDYLSFNIAVYLNSDSTVDVKKLVEGFESDLVENNNYELYYVYSETLDMYPELCYVSPNKQVAIFFEYSVADKAYSVGFYNLSTIEGVQLLKEDAPTALTISNYKTEFEIGDEFTLGDDVVAYVYLMNGQTVEIAVDQLEFKPVTFTEAGEYEVEISYTVDGVTVTDTAWVYVNDPEAEYDDITLIVTNMNVFEDLINQEIDYSAYVIAKSETEPDGEWCEVLIDVENNCVIVYGVNSAASEMTFFVENEEGQVVYYVFVRLVKGQVEYTVTLGAAAVVDGGN